MLSVSEPHCMLHSTGARPAQAQSGTMNFYHNPTAVQVDPPASSPFEFCCVSLHFLDATRYPGSKWHQSLVLRSWQGGGAKRAAKQQT